MSKSLSVCAVHAEIDISALLRNVTLRIPVNGNREVP